MAKNQFSVSQVKPAEAKAMLAKYHYLNKQGKSNRHGYDFGLYKDGKLVGVCIFSGCPVQELAKSMFGLPFSEQRGILELSRLCLDPSVQRAEHNITSWFVARCIKAVRREVKPRCILSYADADHHVGKVYQALGFIYCGLSDAKKDFWFRLPDGSYKKHNRGKVSGMDGEWRPRSRKHRYVLVYDKSLDLKWQRQPYPEYPDLS